MSNVRTEVARRDEERATAPAQVTTAQIVKQMITAQASALGAVLPERLDTERYSRLLITAIKANPKLMAAFATQQGQVSVLLSAMQAAALGLEPNTPTQECWLQPRRKGNVDECELSIGYKGYAKLARRSGQVKTLYAGVVREGDEFEWSRGLEDTFHHKPIAADDAPMTYAYAIARLTNGEVAFTVMTKAQVEKRRDQSESWKSSSARPYSPWTKWTEEMWCKTALRNLLLHGQVELSPELERAASSDESPLTVGEDGMIDALITDMPELEPPSTPPGAAAGNGDRQPSASPQPEGEGEPADAGLRAGEGAPPAADGTVDPTTWTGKEWRDQIAARKIKISDVIKEADRISKETRQLDGPGTIDDLADRPDIALAVAQWMGV